MLRESGYPTKVLVLDFETYFSSTLSLRSLTTSEYIQHPEFEVLALASCYTDLARPPQKLHADVALTHDGVIERLNQFIDRFGGPELPGVTVVAHNAKFDMSVLGWVFDMYPRFIVDTKLLSTAYSARGSNSLKDLAVRWGLGVKGDTMDFKEFSFKHRVRPGTKRKPQPVAVPPATPEQQRAMKAYAGQDALLEMGLLKALLPHFTHPDFELPLMQHTIELFTKPTLRVDIKRAAALVDDITAEANRAVEATGLPRTVLSSQQQFLDIMKKALADAGDDPEEFTKQGKVAELLAASKTDDQRLMLINHRDERVRTLMAGRIAVKSWPLHIRRVERIVNQQRQGWLPVPLVYHGAHTGRWTGDEKINLQNLGNERSHPLIGKIRELILPPPNHRLVVADASQIEARVLAFLADEEELVQGFRNKQDIYVKFASQVLGWPVRAPRPTDPAPIAARMKWARNAIGKVGILGCGYGMGPPKLSDQYGLDMEQAVQVVSTYRDTHARICAFWRLLENTFAQVASSMYRRDAFLPHGMAASSHEEGCDVSLCLPSGRYLRYHHVRTQYNANNGREIEVYNPREKVWTRIWGGALTENVVQAVARDVLADAIMRLERKGLHVAHHVHDELIIVVRTEHAEEALGQAVKTLSRPPAWLAGCPLAAEGAIMERYGDH